MTTTTAKALWGIDELNQVKRYTGNKWLTVSPGQNRIEDVEIDGLDVGENDTLSGKVADTTNVTIVGMWWENAAGTPVGSSKVGGQLNPSAEIPRRNAVHNTKKFDLVIQAANAGQILVHSFLHDKPDLAP